MSDVAEKDTTVLKKGTEVYEKGDKKQLISLDNSTEDVIRFNEEGKSLIFDTTPGQFLELDEGVIRKLDKANRESYFIAFHTWTTASKQLDFAPTQGLSITPNYASATDRLNVSLPEAFKKKYHTCWMRPDQLHSAEGKGYFVVRQKHGVTSFGYDKVRDCHVVGSLGHVELVLMACPVEVEREMLKAVEEKSRLQNGAVASRAKEELKDLGGQPFDNKSFDDPSFKETREG